MKSLLLLLIISFLFTSCGEKGTTVDSSLKVGEAFFENSKRSIIGSFDPRSKGLVRVNGCTGFFVKNENDRNILVSARHCFAFKAQEWCENGGMATVEFSKQQLRCQEVVAGDSLHDIVVFRFEDSIRDRSFDFTLGTFTIQKDMRLAMYGFPADPFNQGRFLTLTENCWVHLPYSFSAYMGDSNNSMNDNFTHNCSTYGGNSGGPMVLEGTRIVAGLPNAYYANDYLNRPSNNSVEGISIPGFVSDFKPSLDLFGIIYETQNSTQTKQFYRAGHFKDILFSSCEIEIQKVNYNTNAFPAFIKLEYKGIDCFGVDYFDCGANHICRSRFQNVNIKLYNPDTFIFYWDDIEKGRTYQRQ